MDRFVTFSDFAEFLDDPPQPLPHEPRVLFAGVLERYKAVDVLLAAWAEVVKTVPHARLTLVGAGSLHPSVRQRVETDLAESAELRDPVPRAELKRMIDASTCLVLPSRSEGLARVVFEGMAHGRPVVASRVGGIEEQLEDGVEGRIVPPEDPSALASALVDVLLYRSVATSMGIAGRERVVARDPIGEYEAGVTRMAAWIAND